MSTTEEIREGFYLSEDGEWIPDGWITGTFGHNGSVQTGFAFKSIHMGDEGIPLIKITEIQPPYVNMSGATRVAIEPYSSKNLRKFEIRKGDSLVAMTGATIGKVGKYLEDEIAWLNQRVAKISGNESTADNFIHYVLKSNRFSQHVTNTSSGSSAQQNISGDELEAYSFPLPLLSEQKAIADVLGSLDDKIELLREQNETLETLAQTLFKRWFIDFNFPACMALPCAGSTAPNRQAVKLSLYEKHPELSIYGYKDFGGMPQPQKSKNFIYVLRLENGNRYVGLTDFLLRRYHEHKTGKGAKATKASPPVAMIHFEEFDSREEAAEREQWLKTGFGRKWLDREEKKGNLGAHVVQAPMIPSELGEIPEGWRSDAIGNYISISGGGTPSTKEASYWNGDIAWSSPKDLSERPDAYLFRTNKTLTEEGLKKITSGINPVGSLLLSSRAPIGYIAFADIPVAVNQGYIVFGSDQYLSNQFMYLWLKTRMNLVINAANGSTFLEISKKSFNNIETVIPSEAILAEFQNLVIPHFVKLKNNLTQIQTLTHLRDTLLPKLMKGEIRVSL